MQVDLTLDSSDEDACPGVSSGRERPLEKPVPRKCYATVGLERGVRSSHEKRRQKQQVPQTEADLEAYLASRGLGDTLDHNPEATPPEAATPAHAVGRKGLRQRKSSRHGDFEYDGRGIVEEDAADGGGSKLKASALQNQRNDSAARAAGTRQHARRPLHETQSVAAGAGGTAGRGGGNRSGESNSWHQFVDRLVARKQGAAGIVLASDSSSDDGGDECPSGVHKAADKRGGAVGAGDKPAPLPPAKRQRRAAIGAAAAGTAVAGPAGHNFEAAVEGPGAAAWHPIAGAARRAPAPAYDDNEPDYEPDDDDDYQPAKCDNDDGDGDLGDFGPLDVWPGSARGPKSGSSSDRGAGGASGSGGGRRGGLNVSDGSDGGGRAAAPARRHGRKTEEERAAEEEEKRRKKEQKQRAKEEKAAAAMAAKFSKEHQKLSDRMANGSIAKHEIVICLPEHFASSAIGIFVSGQLQERRWGMWRAVKEQQPLAAVVAGLLGTGAAGSGGKGSGKKRANGDGGCAVITFQRRKLSCTDVKSIPASVEITEPFEEVAPVPCVLLLFHQPAAFVSLLQPWPPAPGAGSSIGGDPGGGASSFQALLQSAAALHPRCSLQAVVVGLDTYLRTQERRAFQQGSASFSAADIRAAALRLQLSCPAVQLRKVANDNAAGLHLASLTRALGEQPYKATTRDDTLGAAGSGGSFSSASATGMQDLGPGAMKVARCLGRLQGLGGGQVWAVCRQFGGLGVLTQAFLQQQRGGGDPAEVVSELRDPLGAHNRLGTALGSRLAALMTTYDPDELVGHGA